MARNIGQIPNETQGTKFIVLKDPERRKTPPYMRRGTTWRGHHFGHIKLSLIFFFGCVIIILSLAYSALTYKTLVMLPVGIFFIVLYICLVRIAKREFEALPLDHPDRLKYLGFDISQHPSTSTPSSSRADAPLNPVPHAPPSPQAKKCDSPVSSYPHSPHHCGEDPSAYPQGHPPDPVGQYTPADSPSLSSQGNTGYYPLPSSKGDDEPLQYSEI